MCKNHGLEVHEIDCEWGTGVPLDEYEKVLSEDKKHEIKRYWPAKMKPLLE